MVPLAWAMAKKNVTPASSTRIPIGKPFEHRCERHVGERPPDAAGGREHDDAEMHPAQIGDGEGRDEDGDREEL